MKKIMITLVALVMCASMIFVFSGDDSEAAVVGSGTCGDNLTWEYEDSTRTLTIGGSGTTMTDFATTSENPWFSYQVQHIVWTCLNLEHIGNNAFAGHSELTDVGDLPQGLLSIGSNAFMSTGINVTSLPYKIDLIGDGAFQYCTSLALTHLPDKLRQIGNNAFDGCTNLAIKTVPYGVTVISEYAFQNCTSMTTFIVPSTITDIKANSFNGTTNLVNVGNLSNVDISGKFPGATGTLTVTDSGTCGTDLNWTYFRDIGLLYIDGNGTTMTNYTSPNYAPWYGYRTGIHEVSFSTPNLDHLGNYAFRGCTGLTTIDLPDTLASISSNAFSGCTGLTTIDLPDTLTSIGSSAFSGCTGLTTIDLPDTLASISSNAFSGCTRLTTIDLPDTLTSIGSSAFSGCTGLTTIDLPDTLTSISNNAFQDCTGLTTIDLPDSLTSIGSYAFRGCTGLKTVYNYSAHFFVTKGATINGYVGYYADTVQNLANGTCGENLYWSMIAENTLGITGVGTTMDNFPSESPPWRGYREGIFAIDFTTPNLTNLGEYALYRTNIVELTLPSTITDIGRLAIANCSNLTSINIPPSVRTISTMAFYGDTSLTSVDLPLGLIELGNQAFNGCVALISVQIPDNASTLGEGIFRDCSGLTTVHIPNVVTAIPPYMFQNCTSLISIDIPESVTKIGRYAFENTGLVEVTLPNSVISMDSGAFRKSTSLSSITLSNGLRPIPTPIASDTFSGCTNLKTVYNYSLAITIVKGSTNYGLVGYYADTVYNAVSSGTCGTDLNWVMWHEVPNSVSVRGTGTVMENPSPSDFGGHASEIYSVTFDAPNLVKLGDNAFRNCTNLTIDEIPSFITSLGNYTFANCTSLTFDEIAPTCTMIGEGVFSGCTGITSLYIPRTLVSLGAGAFEGCTNLSEVIYDATNVQITSATPFVFVGCTSLTDVTIGENVHLLPNHLFRGVSALETVYFDAPNCNDLSNGNGVFVGTSVSLVVFNDDITSIPSYLCKDMAATLESVSFNDGLTSVGAHAFDGCTKLVVLALPDSVEGVHAYAFNGCPDVALAVLPPSLKDVGAHAFDGCGNTFSRLPLSIEALHTGAFANNLGLKGMVVPDGFNPTFSEGVFEGCTNFAEVLNLSDLAIESGADTYGMIGKYATVSDHFDDIGIVQKKDRIEHEIVTKDDAASVILRILPILLVLSILVFVGMMAYNNRNQQI